MNAIKCHCQAIVLPCCCRDIWTEGVSEADLAGQGLVKAQWNQVLLEVRDPVLFFDGAHSIEMEPVAWTPCWNSSAQLKPAFRGDKNVVRLLHFSPDYLHMKTSNQCCGSPAGFGSSPVCRSAFSSSSGIEAWQRCILCPVAISAAQGSMGPACKAAVLSGNLLML